MKDKTVAILESRAREQLADLVRKYGGRPFSAPALAEIPDVDAAQLDVLIREWEQTPPAVFIFQTGVGTRALFAASDALGQTPTLLRALHASCVVVRGPKPTSALRAREVRIDLAANDPFTTRDVLAELGGTPLKDRRVVVQRYGQSNDELLAALTGRGAQVVELATYRWALPADLGPLLRLIDALGRNEIDLVAFTSAAQAGNLFTVARNINQESGLRQGLARTLVASIGPVCSAALRGFGVRVDIEARPPKLGPFIGAIDGALSGASRAGAERRSTEL
jgi:uroporphyrinogen-III synthase